MALKQSFAPPATAAGGLCLLIAGTYRRKAQAAGAGARGNDNVLTRPG
jgi:hypothetical protein